MRVKTQHDFKPGVKEPLHATLHNMGVNQRCIRAASLEPLSRSPCKVQMRVRSPMTAPTHDTHLGARAGPAAAGCRVERTTDWP